MPLGMELDLSPGDYGLDGDWGPSPPPQKGAEPPIFGQCLLWPNGCMYQDTTWYGGRPQPRRRCVTWGPSCPSPKGAQPRAVASHLVVGVLTTLLGVLDD